MTDRCGEMAERTFIDSNVALYALDDTEPARQARARSVFRSGAASDLVLSTQVLSEVYSVATRKMALDARVVRELVLRLASVHVVTIDADMVLAAIDGSVAWGISYWDALIVRAAERGGCRRLLSEDLSPGRQYGSVRVENPFATV